MPDIDSIKLLYQQLWGNVGPPESINKQFKNHDEKIPIDKIIKPITSLEIDNKIRKLKNKTAGGPDGIRKSHLLIPGISSILCRLYNILLFLNYVPKVWKINRTTLIPKVGKDPTDIKNWRPITIGSILNRLFSGLLHHRLSQGIEQFLRQKGFTAESGCQHNITLLNKAISQAKLQSGGIVQVLDISKAFDTVPHHIIIGALKRKGFPNRICDLVKDMYTNCNTIIKIDKKTNIKIELKRGVKQGDPLSPLLFNLAIEAIIEEIENNTKGIPVSALGKISVLAFADDVALLSCDIEEAQLQVQKFYEYLKAIGMSLSVDKCFAFRIINKKDTWYLEDPKILINKTYIPYAEPEIVFKYLGASISPWKGIKHGIIVPEIIDIIKRIRKLALKPPQKLDLICTYIIPKFIYGLLVQPPSESVLRLLDSEIRQQIKEILHLVPSTAKSFFYTPKRHGGLGIPKLENIIKLGILKSSIKILNSNDMPLKSTLEDNYSQNKLKKLANSLRINWPASIKDIDDAKIRLKNEYSKEWESLKLQGQGVNEFRNDTIGNFWLRNPYIMKAGRYIDALRLRTNTIGTKVVLAQSKNVPDVNCRKCHLQPETLGHIIGLCTHTKPKRINRHDEIKNQMATKLAKQHIVLLEPTAKIGDKLFKPDLVIKKEDRALIVDVTVRYENKNYLQEAKKEKIEKYNHCKEYFKIKLRARDAEVIPIVLGSRGAVPIYTKQALMNLGFKFHEIEKFSRYILRSSIEIVNSFIDYD